MLIFYKAVLAPFVPPVNKVSSFGLDQCRRLPMLVFEIHGRKKLQCKHSHMSNTVLHCTTVQRAEICFEADQSLPTC